MYPNKDTDTYFEKCLKYIFEYSLKTVFEYKNKDTFKSEICLAFFVSYIYFMKRFIYTQY